MLQLDNARDPLALGDAVCIGRVWPSPPLGKHEVSLSTFVEESLGSPGVATRLRLFPVVGATSSMVPAPRSDERQAAGRVRECTSLRLCFRVSKENEGSDVDHTLLPQRWSREHQRQLLASMIMSSPRPAVDTSGQGDFQSPLLQAAHHCLLRREVVPGSMLTLPVLGLDWLFEAWPSSDEEDGEAVIDVYRVGLGTAILFDLKHGDNHSRHSRSSGPNEPPASRQQRALGSVVGPVSVGGLHSQLQALREVIRLSLLEPELLSHYGLPKTRGVLLFGPPGTGKTMLARAIAAEAKAELIVVNGPELVSAYVGESEAALAKTFNDALVAQPSIVFIDEVDTIAPSRESLGDGDASDMERRIVTSLVSHLDNVAADARVLVIAATNRPQDIDISLRRPGRFDQEIEVGVPTPSERADILRSCLSRTVHSLTDDDIQEIADSTHGFVGADLAQLCNEAAMTALRESISQSESQKLVRAVSSVHFRIAKETVRPSAMREVQVEVTRVKWDDVGGQEEVKQALKESVQWPQLKANELRMVGAQTPLGILLFGPPGCSKTLLARAVASEAKLNFLAIKGPELYSKYVGESEKAVRDLFRKARQVAPAIIFIDEIDGMVASRAQVVGLSGDDAGSVGERVLSQLLMEMDGLVPLNGVVVVAATNRPDRLDPALLRPGRLDRLLYVPPPTDSTRAAIFRIHLRKTPIDESVSVAELAERTEGYTGADIAGVCREAALAALKEDIQSTCVSSRHFGHAISVVRPSKSSLPLSIYESFMRPGFRLQAGTR